MLLIITNADDFSVDYLIVKLIEKKLHYTRINSEQLTLIKANFEINNEQISQEINFSDNKKLKLDEVRSIWYRRALNPKFNNDLSIHQKFFIEGESRNFWNGIIFRNDIKWVNSPKQIFEAENKLIQLKTAKSLGLSIPRTLISNSSEKLREFASEQNSVICKPIYHGRYIDDLNQYAIYTRRVESEELKDDSEIEICQVFLQEEIKRIADLRVTFIGEKVFAVRIKSDDKNLIDWRKPDTRINYEKVEIPSCIYSKCKRMLEHWNLYYAAFDFIESEDEKWIFLEINPTGEWAWLENILDIPMREAFIELFYG